MEIQSKTPPWALWLLGLALLSHLISWFAIGPLQDEAYYWTWTQYPQLSYFDHPPMVAWMMLPFTLLLGDHIWVIRLPMVLAWLAAAWMIYQTARRLYDDPRAGLYALLVWTSLPIVMGGFHVATPDTPLVLFTALTYLLFFQALDLGRDRDWMATGAAAGLALVSKYTAILVPGALFLALLLTRRGRALLATRGPWLAVAALLVMFLPVVVWNAQNHWVSFLFQIHHGVKNLEPDAGALLLAYIVGQLGVALPWTFIAMLVASLRMGSHDKLDSLQGATLRLGFWIPILVFGLAGLTAESGANWTLTAFIPGSVILAATLARWTRDANRRTLVLAFLYLLPVLLLNLFRYPQWMEALDFNPPQRTQLTHSYGWDRVDKTLQGELRKLGERGKSCTVMGMNYQLASELALLLKDAHRVTTPEGSRISQFDYWRLADSDVCLYVEQYDHPDGRTRTRLSLPDGSTWRRVALLENHNPDNTVRWFGFFQPLAQE